MTGGAGVKGLGKRLARVAAALTARPRADQFDIIEVVAAGEDRAGGLPPGLHRTGPDGSTVGLLVYDPAAGEPAVPEGRLAPCGLVIRCHLDVVGPPAETPGDEPGGGAPSVRPSRPG